MDDTLAKIVAEANQAKLLKLTAACNAAQEVLCDRSSLLKCPVYELREKCLEAIRLALESKNSKLKGHAVHGLQQLLRDELYWTVDSEDEKLLLPLQFCKTIQPTIVSQQDGFQVDLLKVLLEMSCTGASHLTPSAIEAVLIICLQVVNNSTSNSTTGVVVAAEATSSQTFQCYTRHVIGRKMKPNLVFEEELYLMLTMLCQKVSETRKAASSSKVKVMPIQMGLLLKCIHAMLLPIPSDTAIISEKFLSFIWQTLCPLLVKLLSLGINKIRMTQKSNFIHESPNSHDYGRGSEGLQGGDVIKSSELKQIYSIAMQLIKLFGTTTSMRPVLESLFHRMLLYPPIHLRGEALKAVKEIFKDPKLTVRLSCPPTMRFGQMAQSRQFDLLKIFMDSLKECSYSSETSIAHQSVICTTHLLDTLEKILNGAGIDNPSVLNAIAAASSCPILSSSTHDLNFNGSKTDDGYCPSTSSDDSDHEEAEVEKKKMAKLSDEEAFMMRKDFKDFELNDYRSKLDKILNSFDSERDSKTEVDNVSPKEAAEPQGSRASSTETEGPETEDYVDYKQQAEEGEDGQDTEEDEEEEDLNSETASKLKSLFESESYQERSRIQRLCDSHDKVARSERENARGFVKSLKKLVPFLLNMKTTLQVDDAIQSFASDYCKDLWEKQKGFLVDSEETDICDHIIIINGDGIYLTAYLALSLNCKLLRVNYYNGTSDGIEPPMTEQQFVNEIQGSGLLVYLSATWSAEVYQQILTTDLLSEAGYSPNILAYESIPLINLIVDIDGLGDTQPGSQELSDYKKLTHTKVSSSTTLPPEAEAGQRLVGGILTTFWSSMLTTLGSLFRNENDSTTQSLLMLLANTDLHKENQEKREILVQCLDGLQVAARLCITLGLQSRCNGIFDLLTKSVCPMDLNSSPATDLRSKLRRHSLLPISPNKPTLSLHTSQALSMKAILTSALEIGSHCPPCWEFVFKCCDYIINLEYNYFSQRSSVGYGKSRTTLSLIRMKAKDTTDQLDLSFCPATDMDSLSSSPGFPPGFPGGMDSMERDASEALTQCINECIADNSAKCVLKDKRLEQAIQCLYQLAEKMFDDSASKLNLKSLIGFLNALSACSRHELIMRRKQTGSSIKSPLLFSRLCDVMLRVSKSGRPLAHFMSCWNSTVPLFVEASCHRNDIVAKTAISTINDIITVILSTHTELSHFHFNEALFKPYETLLLLELCDIDIQEMIISSICGFVEGSGEDIKSGWRSLFGALRGIQMPNIPFGCSAADAYELEVERVRQLRVILDIFEAFLNTHNLQIFANAAVDCLLCLFRLLKDPLDEETPTDYSKSFTSDDPSQDPSSVDLCLLSLKYLHQFESMLRSMYQMPACPMFSSTRRITVCSEPKIIDIPRFSENELTFDIPYVLVDLDRPVRILHVWFLLLDGVCNSIMYCPKQHQPKAIEMSLALTGTLRENPGIEFAVYCINHIILPLLQRWQRELNIQYTLQPSNPLPLTNFRHFCGLVSHIAVEHLRSLADDSDLSKDAVAALNLMLSQVLVIFIEPMEGDYHETLLYLASACIRHILVESSAYLKPSSWDVVCLTLQAANKLCLRSLVQLNHGFKNQTINFFEDLNQVKIVTKRESTPSETERLCGFSQQIFLLDSQRSEKVNRKLNLVSEGDDRSFVFVIESSDDQKHSEVSFRSLVYELNCHQLLIKTVAKIVLKGITKKLPNISSSLMDLSSTERPFLETLDEKHVNLLLSVLLDSYNVMLEFESRPGLKFLLQKVSRLEVPANLYKQAALCFSASFLAFFHICCQSDGESGKREAHLKQIEALFEKVCDDYTDFIVQNEKTNPKLDEICSQPIFLMMSDVPEFKDVIAGKTQEVIVGESGVSSAESSPSKGSTKSNVSTESGDDVKVYTIMSQKTIDKMTVEYKKWKKQYAPIPPSFHEKIGRKRDLPKRYAGDNCTSAEKTNEKYLLKDAEAFTSLWSQILQSVVELHLALPPDLFKERVSVFEPGIESLIMYTTSKELKSALALWVRTVSKS